jgi:hypothetical protein
MLERCCLACRLGYFELYAQLEGLRHVEEAAAAVKGAAGDGGEGVSWCWGRDHKNVGIDLG